MTMLVPSEHSNFLACARLRCRRMTHAFERFEPAVQTIGIQPTVSSVEHHIWYAFSDEFRDRFAGYHAGILDVLPGTEREGWTEQRGFYQDLFRAMFHGSDVVSFIAVIPQRMPFRSRFAGSSDLNWVQDDRRFLPIRPTSEAPSGMRLEEVDSLEFGFGMKAVEMGDLLFVDDGAEARLYKIERERVVCRRSLDVLWSHRKELLEGQNSYDRFRGMDRVYFVCHPDRFTGAEAAVDFAPVMARYEVGGFYTTTTITLARIESTVTAIQLLITLDPESGNTVALAAGMRHPTMLFLHYESETSLSWRALGLRRLGHD